MEELVPWECYISVYNDKVTRKELNLEGKSVQFLCPKHLKYFNVIFLTTQHLTSTIKSTFYIFYPIVAHE